MNFQASPAISSAVAIRYGMSTPASRNAASRRLSNVKYFPFRSTSRIAGISPGYTAPLRNASANPFTEPPSPNAPLTLLWLNRIVEGFTSPLSTSVARWGIGSTRLGSGLPTSHVPNAMLTG